MNIILMFVWSFIIKAIPFKRIFAGLTCFIIVIGLISIMGRYENITQPNKVIHIMWGSSQ